MSDTKKLWKNIEPHLKKALTTLYLREVSSTQWERYQQELEASDNAALQGVEIVCLYKVMVADIPIHFFVFSISKIMKITLYRITL